MFVFKRLKSCYCVLEKIESRTSGFSNAFEVVYSRLTLLFILKIVLKIIKKRFQNSSATFVANLDLHYIY